MCGKVADSELKLPSLAAEGVRAMLRCLHIAKVKLDTLHSFNQIYTNPKYEHLGAVGQPLPSRYAACITHHTHLLGELLSSLSRYDGMYQNCHFLGANGCIPVLVALYTVWKSQHFCFCCCFMTNKRQGISVSHKSLPNEKPEEKGIKGVENTIWSRVPSMPHSRISQMQTVAAIQLKYCYSTNSAVEVMQPSMHSLS